MDFSEIERLLKILADIRSEKLFLSKTTEQEVVKYGVEYGIVFPRELQEWLCFCNGTSLADGNFLGINRNDASYLEISGEYDYEPLWKDKEWIPIGGDGCGDFYIMDAKSKIKELHPIYFIDQAGYDKAAYIVASNLWSFLKFKIMDSILFFQHDLKYFWPFDKEKVLVEDTDIALCTTAPLPWDLD